MGPPSYTRFVVDRNAVMWRMTVLPLTKIALKCYSIVYDSLTGSGSSTVSWGSQSVWYAQKVSQFHHFYRPVLSIHTSFWNGSCFKSLRQSDALDLNCSQCISVTPDTDIIIKYIFSWQFIYGLNRLTPNDPCMGRTTPLTSKRCILYIYSTNIGTEYFKHTLYSPFFSLQNAVCFIMLTCLVHVLFTFYIQGVLKLKK